MLSRRAISTLIVAVVFVGSCDSDTLFNTLFSPSKAISYAYNVYNNICSTFTKQKPKTAGSDANFQKLFKSPDKKAVVVTFKKGFDKNTGTEGLKSFDDGFLTSLLGKHSEADVIVVDADKCPETATKYRVPKTSEKALFNISLRFKTKEDFMNQSLLEIIPELLKHSDPKQTESIKTQVDLIMDSVLKAKEHDGRLDDKLSHNVHEIMRTLGPKNHQQQGATNVKKYASKKTDIKVRNVEISETETEKVFLGPVSVRREQEEITQNPIQIVTTKCDTEVEHALSNAKHELIIMFITNNSFRKVDIELKKFLRRLLTTESNAKIIQVNADTNRCGNTFIQYSIKTIPTILFVKYGTFQDAQVTSYNSKALEAEIINLFANKVIVKSDLDFSVAISNAANELIILNFTDNSLNDDDCGIKLFLSSLSNKVSYIKIIQVNTNTGNCQETIDIYKIESLPSVLFIKHGKIQAARITSYDNEALKTEKINLLSRSIVVDSDKELTDALLYQDNELIVLFITDNSLNKNDRDMKKLLSGVSFSALNIKIIQVNVNTENCEDTINKYAIRSYPTLVFLKEGKFQVQVTHFERQTIIITELLNLISATEVVNSDDDLHDALLNAENELIILNITDNSENDDDCNLKEFLSMFSEVESDIKIIQVNANSGTCRTFLDLNHISVYPSMLFLKRGKMLKARMTGFHTNGIKAEISTLISNSVLVDSDEELSNLSYAESELSIMFFTDNSLDSNDCEMKMFLNSISISEQRVNLIQVNTNARKCSDTMSKYNITSHPALLFFKRGILQNTRVIGFDLHAIDAEKSNLLSRSVIIADSDYEIANVLGNDDKKLTILFFTNNSLDECDCEMKKILSSLANNTEGLKIIRVNTNTGKCMSSINQYNINSFPSLLFIKNSETQPTRVTSCEGNIMKSEICNFLSQSIKVDSDDELTKELSNAKNQLIIINITNNSFDKDDFGLKMFLSDPSIRNRGIKIIQVNANSNKCNQIISVYRIGSFPSLIFLKNGIIPAVRLAGFNEKTIKVQINHLLLPSEVVGYDRALYVALLNARQELVVVYITDNSDNDSNCDMIEYLYSLPTHIGHNTVKIIEVNVNTGNCRRIISENNIRSYPSVLFIKRGKLHLAKVSGFNRKAMDAEISNLLTDKIQVNKDGELTTELSNAAHELIIVHFTDNSLNDNDCDIKLYLSTVLNKRFGIKILQVNTNSRGCRHSVRYYDIVSQPTVLFIKHGRMQMARITSYDKEALEAETINLQSTSIVVNNDKELTTALMNQNNELIVIFVTDNSLDKNDCGVKKILYNEISSSVKNVKTIQLNANTKNCEKAIQNYAIQTYPSLLFFNHGVMQGDKIVGFDEVAINNAIDKLVKSASAVPLFNVN